MVQLILSSLIRIITSSKHRYSLNYLWNIMSDKAYYIRCILGDKRIGLIKLDDKTPTNTSKRRVSLTRTDPGPLGGCYDRIKISVWTSLCGRAWSGFVREFHALCGREQRLNGGDASLCISRWRWRYARVPALEQSLVRDSLPRASHTGRG